jgi:hypothetical protein
MVAAILWLALVPRDVVPPASAAWRSPAVRCEAMTVGLRIAAALRPILAEMCRRSPTFRRQVARLASERDLVVTITETAFPQRTPWRALTAIDCFSGRVRSADVQVQPGDPRAVAELIAHEFEHILEQLDGVALSRWIGRSGVHRIGRDGPIETERARQVGLLVAGEYLEGAPELSARRR